MSGPPRQAFAYARVSTEDQADEGLGIAAQLDAARAAIGERDWVLAGEIVDAGVSGSVPPPTTGRRWARRWRPSTPATPKRWW